MSEIVDGIKEAGVSAVATTLGILEARHAIDTLKNPDSYVPALPIHTIGPEVMSVVHTIASAALLIGGVYYGSKAVGRGISYFRNR